MRSYLLPVFLFTAIAMAVSGCEKKTGEVQMAAISDYLPLEPGRYIIYRTDSTVFVNFGRDIEIHSYEEKHVVDAELTDNIGRPAYRIFRFIRDTSLNAPWQSAGSYFITPLKNSAEFIENNLRIVRLALPLSLGSTWHGNHYLPLEPFYDIHTFSNDDDMQNWQFAVTGTGQTMDFNGQEVKDIITIEHVNETVNVPITIPTAYAAINYSVDKFAKGIGLVFQEFIMWEYQPNPGGPSPYYIGFGIKRSMIDHN